MNVWLKENMHASSFVVIVLINTFYYANTLSDLENDSYAFINFKFTYNNNLMCVLIEKRIVNKFEKNAIIIDHAIKFLININENQQ